MINLGCAKNVVDSEEVLGFLSQDGYRIQGVGRRADVVVVNTCGFLEAARDESIAAIEEVAQRKRRGEVGRLIVAGCMVRNNADRLAEIAEIDALIGPGRNDLVAQAAADRSAGDRLVMAEPSPAHSWQTGAFRVLATPPWSAYLKIAEGCDHTCAFCTIPSIRGSYTSKPLDAILAEAAELASRGVREINLIAQDTTRYGLDLPGRPDLGLLLRELSAIDGLRWIRVFYAYPSPTLIGVVETMASLPKVCPYLDIPLQHSDPAVLRSMRRPGDGTRYLGMIERMREILPDIAIRTTLIAGLPGETDEAFDNLLGFVEQARFDRLGVFEFSPEPGTDAASMPDQVPAEVRARRRDRLMRLQQAISLERNRRWIGRQVDVLIERSDARSAIGRTFRDGPEVDGTIRVKDLTASPGTFHRVRVTGADVYDLTGRPVGAHAHQAGRRLRRQGMGSATAARAASAHED